LLNVEIAKLGGSKFFPVLFRLCAFQYLANRPRDVALADGVT
jgi:hypothetical protein